MEEIWKDIIGYEGTYQISNFGKIKSLKRKINYPDGRKSYYSKEIIRKQCSFSISIYPYITLIKNKIVRIFSIHRLIAIHFIPNPENKPQINHINGNRLDFSIKNLEWTTQSENIFHAYKTGQRSSIKGITHKYKKRIGNGHKI